MSKKIFITGISGCVGHYLFDELSKGADLELYLLVRTPGNLKFPFRDNPRVKIVRDDLANIKNHAALIKAMDYVVHLAVLWGGHQTNLDYTLDLLGLLDPHHCQKVIYFSTASILDENNQPLAAAEKFGTHYIRSKYQLHQKLSSLPIYPKVVTLFPTWVLGGDQTHLDSHASAGLKDLKKWLWLIRFFTVDASFHFIHAQDIAQIVKYLLDHETAEREFVLGNECCTAGRFIKEVCEFYHQKVYFQIPISLPLVKFLAAATGRKLHPWDEFCFKKRHFKHRAVSARSFGLVSHKETVAQVLAN